MYDALMPIMECYQLMYAMIHFKELKKLLTTTLHFYKHVIINLIFE